MSATETYYLERALRALELLAMQPLSAPQIAAALQIHPRTARRLLTRLHAEQYLDHGDDHRRLYWPTLRLVALAGQIVDHARLAQQAVPYVQRLHDLTGGAAHLVIPSYRSALCIVHAAADWPARAEIRELVPCHCTATGKVLLSHRQPWRDSVLRTPLEARTRHTQTDPARLRIELDAVRETGYAVDAGELRPGERGAAAPVVSWGGSVIAASASPSRQTPTSHRSANSSPPPPNASPARSTTQRTERSPDPSERRRVRGGSGRRLRLASDEGR